MISWWLLSKICGDVVLSNMKKSIELEELKRIQLDMLVDIDRFCRANNIRYSLAYGTLLGAIRHGGYIPWDDDIDVCMPRPDYERFISSYTGCQGRYKCYSTKTSPEYMLPFAKVSDERTVMRETLYENDEYGIYIDVFPVDAMGAKGQIFKSIWLNRFLNTQKAVLGHRSLKKDIVLALGKIVLYPISISKVLSAMETVATKYKFGDTPTCEVFCSSTVEREIVPTSYFLNYNDAIFEGMPFSVVKDFDSYLTVLYGDWRKEPPVEERVSTHVFNAWWRE